MMEREQIIQAIRNIMHDITDIPLDELLEDVSIVDDLDMTSIEILTSIGRIEEACKVRFQEDRLGEFVTIGDIADYIEGYHRDYV